MNLLPRWSVTEWKEKWKFHWKPILAFIALGLLIFGLILDSSKKSSTQKLPVERVELDRLAPQGHSLFPIRVLNHEALSHVMGVTGVVSLYNEKTNELMVESLKLIRSQNDSETLLALVPDRLMTAVLSADNKSVAVLKNPKEKTGTKFVNKVQQVQRPVYYGRDQL